MINVKNISKVFYTDKVETHALDSVSLTVNKGEFISIMGPSGCGKSTLLSIIGLLDNPSDGIIEIDGINVAGLKDSELARIRNQKLGFIFQNFHLIPSLSVLENVMLPMLYRQNASISDSKKRAKDMLERVELSHRMQHLPTQLSGGQCQRVAIARALMGAPEVLLADEPTGNLDSKMGIEIMDILTSLHKEGTTIAMVTHDGEIAKKTSRIVKLLDGKIDYE